MVASQIKTYKHQELSSLNNRATSRGIQISTNNNAHTIVRNISIYLRYKLLAACASL